MKCPGHLEWVYMDHVAKGGKATEEIQWSVGKRLRKEGARPQWVPETQKKLREWCLEEVMNCKKKKKNNEVSGRCLRGANNQNGRAKSPEARPKRYTNAAQTSTLNHTRG